jgi:hypothetical protein
MNQAGKETSNFLLKFASRLRFPYLFALTALILLVDLALPDLIPFVDEVLLGLATLLLGTRRRRDQAGSEEGGVPQRETSEALPKR